LNRSVSQFVFGGWGWVSAHRKWTCGPFSASD